MRRRRDGGDKRRLQLTLTAKGQRIRESHSVLDRQKVGAMLARLSEPARASAVRGLELLALAATREIEAHAGREATA